MGRSAESCVAYSDDTMLSELPAASSAAVRESLGAAVSGSFGADIADTARTAFVDAMSRASLVTALVAALGAYFAWR